jgi:hypothetical protein
MAQTRPELFGGRYFRDEIIILCVRWYLRYPLSYRNLEEMMAERGVTVDHSTIARWVLRYAPVLNERIRSEMRNPNRSWRCDETYIRVAGDHWLATALFFTYLWSCSRMSFMYGDRRHRQCRASPPDRLKSATAPAASDRPNAALQHIQFGSLPAESQSLAHM